MQRLLLSLLLLVSFLCGTQAQTAQRRPIDREHPMWLIHVDVWNKADPQKIIDLIPEDVRPYVVMNLSLSCGYDVERGVHKMPQNAIPTYKSWGSICQLNNMWFTCQPASGGHTHILDDDIETFEYFFKNYPNFLGWNFAEQFWGFNEAGDKYSSSDVNRIALFARLVEMSHQYGGLLTISFCGNIWSHLLNPVGMMKRNPDLLAACQKYPESILWLYKYTTSSCFYNNESVCFGPFVAGLAANYGVRYDNCGWNGATADLVGENKCKYPVSAGIGTVMEQTCQNGGAVWDGPELIWTEDFQNLSNTQVSGYTRRNWGTFPGFDNAWIDMFRKVIDGTLYIPSRQEVVEKTKIIVINNVTSGNDEDKYAAWGDLYDGLYKQTDPFNRGNGQWMDNYCYFKSSGRYGTIPITPMLNDSLAKTIPNQVKKSARNSVWSTQANKRSAFNKAYPLVSEGDLFVSRFKNQLITYTPYTYLNVKKTAKAKIALQYNTCDSLRLQYGKLSSGAIREWSDSIVVYLNNYRTDTTALVEDLITVVGATSEPTYVLKKRARASASHTAQWDATAGTYTLSVKHMGPVDIVIRCQGAATDRSTDVAPMQQLTLPVQPQPFTTGIVIKEAEDMDYTSITSCVTDPFNWYPKIYGHSGNGFADMGTNKAGSLKTAIKLPEAGEYRLQIRYLANSKDVPLTVKVNNSQRNITCRRTPNGKWGNADYTFKMVKGSNNILITNGQGISCYVDFIRLIPAGVDDEKFAINLRPGLHGTATSDVASAAEGEAVQLTPVPDPGYRFVGWNIIHGRYFELSADNVLTMADDQVTLEPLFIDATSVYAIDFTDVVSGTFPPGWQAQDGTDVHAYPNNYGSGPRSFSGFTGVFPKALYWRVTNTSYGRQSAYKLHLKPSHYRLSWNMAAWKGSPQYKAQILTAAGNTLAETTYFTAEPDANGHNDADLTRTPEHTLEFEVKNEGDYIIQFQNNGAGFSEFLLAACRVNDLDALPIEAVVAAPDDLDLSQCRFFDAQGREMPSLQPGMNFIVRGGQMVKRVFLK